ncbi:SDR family oxidoreductase [Blastococcus sp. PRF04-17]|uniref:SDR family oxidoreductase n=1 Tax=Blastococcus sp. PRF04-17 TaxID=2933797 RepID=UPI001FF1DA9B|nr:SDR family NAD(P)-dependent oxidoreductase [Blastococcus sp. PRF04-17]UOY01776.1 SDR family NAD(P)-dependent oxidoreductase [Blastococcus sp. PRF04-17]
MAEDVRRGYVVTGAGSGIGAAITRSLLGAGYSVVATGRTEQRLAALAEEADAGERLTVTVADAGSWEANERVVELCADRYGRIDGVVANAGYTVPGDVRTSDVSLWPDMVATNVLGPAYLARAAATHLEASGGRIVIIGSVAGHKNSPGNLYGATKWAATGLAENLRMLFAPVGVGVSLVSPGVVDTGFYPAGVPEVRIGPGEIAAAVQYVLECPSDVDLSTVVVRPRRQLL